MLNSNEVNTINNESANVNMAVDLKNTPVDETKKVTPQPIEYPETRDGYDISWIESVKIRRMLRYFVKDNFLNFLRARRLMKDYDARIREGYCVKLVTGDYLFTEMPNNIYLGYILNVRSRVYNHVEWIYLDIAVDGSRIKTVKCQLGSRDDIVSKGVLQRFGSMVTFEDLLYEPVVIQVANKTDNMGNAVFSIIQQFFFVHHEYINHINNVAEKMSEAHIG